LDSVDCSDDECNCNDAQSRINSAGSSLNNAYDHVDDGDAADAIYDFQKAWDCTRRGPLVRLI
jgi:hypothetical protein